MMYLIHSLDDLEDAVDSCREIALMFPDLGPAEVEIGIFENWTESAPLFNAASAWYKDRDEVAVADLDYEGSRRVVVIYTLNDEELEKAEAAFEDYLEHTGCTPLNIEEDDSMEDIADMLMTEIERLDLFLDIELKKHEENNDDNQ